MKKDDALDYMDRLESEDVSLNELSQRFSALASFLADYDFLKDRNHLSQKDVAKKMKTTQSAISRIERFKTNPSYLQLKKMAEAVGGGLFISPMEEYSLTVPVDLQEKLKILADKRSMSVTDYLERCIREAIGADYEELKVDSEDRYFYSNSCREEQQWDLGGKEKFLENDDNMLAA